MKTAGIQLPRIAFPIGFRCKITMAGVPFPITLKGV